MDRKRREHTRRDLKGSFVNVIACKADITGRVQPAEAEERESYENRMPAD